MINYRRKFCWLRKPDAGDEGGGEPAVDSSAGSGAIGTGNDARLAMLAMINDANDAENAGELADVNEDGTTTPFLVADDEAEELQAEVPTEVEVPVEPAAKKFKIKVNGKDVELTEEELIARAQKVESADQYLADAARQRRDATRLDVVPAGPSAAELQLQRDEEDRAIVRAIQMGTEEEALLAVRKLEERRARPSVTTDDMSRAIDERLAFNEAISLFRTEFADISGDAMLNSLAQQRDSEMIASGDSRSYAERYRQIGGELRAWKESLAPAPVKDPASTALDAKAAKKAAAPSVPASATKKVVKVEPEEEDGEEDARSVIANIAKARGGPQWMRS